MNASVIVAAAANDVIGRDGALPWHLRGDLRRFRALTTSHVVVMGRVTHESILSRLGHPLANRTSIVVSRTLRDAGDDRVLLATSPESALAAAASIGALAGSGEFFVIGGGGGCCQGPPPSGRRHLTPGPQNLPRGRPLPGDGAGGVGQVSPDGAAQPAGRGRCSFLH